MNKERQQQKQKHKIELDVQTVPRVHNSIMYNYYSMYS